MLEKMIFLMVLSLAIAKPFSNKRSDDNTYSTPSISSALLNSDAPYLVLNNGQDGLKTGALSSHYKWQASGIMTVGGCEKIANELKEFDSCFAMFLAPDGQIAPTKREISQEKRQEDWSSNFEAWIAEDFKKPATKKTMKVVRRKKRGNEDWAENFEAWIKEDFGKYAKRSQIRTSASEDNPDSRKTDAQAVKTAHEHKSQKELEARNYDVFDAWVESEVTGRSDMPDLASRGLSTRQRNEILTWPPAPSGEEWQYTWKSWIHGLPKSSQYFFHVWQVLKRDAKRGNGPVVSLGFIKGRAMIADYYRGCSDCNSVDLSEYVDKLISHTINVKYGKDGYFKYSAIEHPSGKNILSYSTTGDMGDQGSLKIGLYRRLVNGMSSALGVLADFSATKLA